MKDKKQSLIKTKDWKGLMDEYIPDEVLMKKHRELLDKKKVFVITRWDNKKNKLVSQEGDEIDVKAVSEGLDMSYKLKNRYSDEMGGNKTIVINITGIAAQKYGIKSISSSDNS